MATQLGKGGGKGSGQDAAAPGIGSNTAPHLAYHDLRKWLDEAENLGEVKHVKGLSWQKDIGMVSEMAAHTDNAPCFVFEDVPGTLPGSRVLINFFDGKRKNMTLGFPTDMSKVELSEGFRAHYAADMKRIRPKYVESGPVMQNVVTGDAIDITKFPAPHWHGLLHHHPGPRRWLDQLRHLPRNDPRREHLRPLYLSRQAGPADARQVQGAQAADADCGRARR